MQIAGKPGDRLQRRFRQMTAKVISYKLPLMTHRSILYGLAAVLPQSGMPALGRKLDVAVG